MCPAQHMHMLRITKLPIYVYLQYILKDHQDDLFCEIPGWLGSECATNSRHTDFQKGLADSLMSKQGFLRDLLNKINQCMELERQC